MDAELKSCFDCAEMGCNTLLSALTVLLKAREEKQSLHWATVSKKRLIHFMATERPGKASSCAVACFAGLCLSDSSREDVRAQKKA